MVTPRLRAYRALLRLFPGEFRRERGGEMERLFLEMTAEWEEERGRPGLRFWIPLMWDTTREAVGEWVGMWRQTVGSTAGLRGERGDGFMRTVLREIRLASRGLFRMPGQTVAAIITLGLGIGITTAEFSLLYGLFYRALPFEDGEELVHVYRSSLQANQIRSFLPARDYAEWRDAQRSFTELGGMYIGSVGLRGPEAATRFNAAFVSWNAFRILGAQPVMGRSFLEEDDQPDAPLVAILSHRVWEERFGSDAGIVGREAVLNGEPATIMGVMPDGFHFPEGQDMWVPLRLNANQIERGQGPYLETFGRLREGVTLELAGAEMTGIAERIALAHPDTNDFWDLAIVRPYDDLAANRTSFLINWMIMASALGVLLIAGVNVANLLLARAAVRTREIALRTAMGARRLQIMILMLAESSILAGIGALLGAGLAWLGVLGLRYALVTASDLPYWMEIKLDLPVLLFTAGAAALAGIVAGMIPAVRATAGNLTDALKDGARGATGLQIGRLSRSLIAVQVAFSACLLIVAGLMTKTVSNIASFDFPFDEQGVFTAGIDLFDATDSDEERLRLFDELQDRLEEVPGVQAGALASDLPGAPSSLWTTVWEVDGFPDAPVESMRLMAVSPGFFDLMGVPVRGRDFSPMDRAGEQFVAIVNESFVRRYFPGQDPIGRQLRSGGPNRDAGTSRTIVGVVPDLMLEGIRYLERQADIGFYLPLAQARNWSARLLVRSQGAPLELTDGVRDFVQSVDPDVAIFNVGTLAAAIRVETLYFRIVGAIYVIFGAVALFMASVGLFSVVSFGAERRTQEVGIRMAVGATARDVVGLIVRQGVIQVAAGLVVGIAMAVGLARVMVAVLFETKPWDPAVYAVIVALILVVGVAASLVPAIRAARMDPVRALQAQ